MPCREDENGADSRIQIGTGNPGLKHTMHSTGTMLELAISTTCQVVGRNGMRALWIVFGITGMVIASAVFALRSSTIVMSRRLYHVITTLITIISALSYFAMASGHAAAFICQTIREDHKHVPNILRHVCREVFWARFVDSSLTIPLLLLELCLLAGVDGAHTLMAIVAVLVMVLSGLFAAFGCDNTAQTWGWFAIACFSYLFVIWHVAVHGSQTFHGHLHSDSLDDLPNCLGYLRRRKKYICGLGNYRLRRPRCIDETSFWGLAPHSPSSDSGDQF
ncbi:uncharacterized protein FOBCDRAFT_296163 [Fusarium oxysporum Fo47]|uniref:uncharacterized protein n=1 Tax=Fusarium oxysporum Fo47 TaxID=660027 RepID=UPI0028698F88|nr:uncharacterized protein FOBCDRAFT_296163 [Fusarium oxysporum Fo47]WJG35818.1 hypothetical protein FOBCDRAFT_296163 [Fusarium oxysporum Fo47]